MSNMEYELLLDVQSKKCYTCTNYRKCNVLNDNVSCDYHPSKKTKSAIRGTKGFLGLGSWNN